MCGYVDGLGDAEVREQKKYLGRHPGLCTCCGSTGASTVSIAFTSAPTILSGVQTTGSPLWLTIYKSRVPVSSPKAEIRARLVGGV